METVRIIHGRIVGPRSVELEESLPAGQDPRVEVVVRPLATATLASAVDFLRSRASGSRTREEIDRQIDAARSSWDGD